MLKALTASLTFAYVSHSPALSAWLLPAVGAVVAAEAAYVLNALRRKKARA